MISCVEIVSPFLTTIYMLYIILQVEKSSIFRREGADVHSDVHISLAQAVLGGKLTTPGIYKDIQLNVSTSFSHLIVTYCKPLFLSFDSNLL